MSITETLIKIGGFILAFVGFALLLAVVGFTVFGISFTQFGPIGEIIIGIVFLALGIVIVKGGTPSV